MSRGLQHPLVVKAFDRERLTRHADYVAVALAIVLPWSTSATGALVAVWLALALAATEAAALRRELTTPAGGLPVLLCALGAAGMLWADVSWSERFAGLTPFLKLLLLPLFLAHFRRSERVQAVLIGFVASCVVLVMASFVIFAVPEWTPRGKQHGVPVKDHLALGATFLICIAALAWFAAESWSAGRRWPALAAAALAVMFLANVLFVLESRTSLVVAPVLALAFVWVRYGWRAAAAAAMALVLLAAAALSSGVYRPHRAMTLIDEVRQHHSAAPSTSAGERIEFWRKSVAFIADAPAIGHGTGSIRALFRKAAEGQTGVGALVAANPHQQTFTIAIQLGALGALMLWAMWLAHLLLFRGASAGAGTAAWLGLVLVFHNVVGSLFNSHLSDFTHGWLYVIGVGIAGGVVLRGRDPPRPP